MARTAGRTRTRLPAGLAVFMAAIRAQESGGNYHEPNGDGGYQILASNWPEWAAEAGYPANEWPNASAAPPAVQDAVARHKILSYFYGPAHGSWYAVAQAWNGGAGCIDANCSNSAIPGGVNGYARQVLSRMRGIVPGSLSAGPPGSGPLVQGSNAAGDAPTGIVTCYAKLPTVHIGVLLGHGPSVGGWCIDGLVFGLLALSGGAVMIVGAALIAKGVGSNSAAVNAVVNKTRAVTKV